MQEIVDHPEDSESSSQNSIYKNSLLKEWTYITKNLFLTLKDDLLIYLPELLKNELSIVENTGEILIASMSLFKARDVTKAVIPELFNGDKELKKNLATAWIAIGRYYAAISTTTGNMHISWELAALRNAEQSAAWNDPLKPWATFQSNMAKELRSPKNSKSTASNKNNVDELRESWQDVVDKEHLEGSYKKDASLWFAYVSLIKYLDLPSFKQGIETFKDLNSKIDDKWVPYFYQKTVLHQLLSRKRIKQYRRMLPKGAPPAHEFQLTFPSHKKKEW